MKCHGRQREVTRLRIAAARQGTMAVVSAMSEHEFAQGPRYGAREISEKR